MHGPSVGLYEAQNDIITKVSYGIIDNKRKTLKLAHKKERFVGALYIEWRVGGPSSSLSVLLLLPKSSFDKQRILLFDGVTVDALSA